MINTKNRIEFGRRLKNARIDKNISRQQLAKAVNVTYSSAVATWESGSASIPKKYIDALSSCLGIPKEDFPENPAYTRVEPYKVESKIDVSALTSEKVKKQPTYMLTDHACRDCDGRILLGPGGGAGAAMVGECYMCADCEETHFGNVSGLCWCGLGQRHQQPGEYLCMRLGRAIAEPWLRDAMGHSGVDPDSKKIKVAMVNRQAIRNAEERAKK